MTLPLTREPVTDAFRPHPWLTHPHLQTLAGAGYRRVPSFETRREWLEAPDGERLALDWIDSGEGWEGRRPELSPVTVLVLHGLTGTSSSPIVRSMMAAARAVPARVVGMNFRGSLEPPARPRLYHAGSTADLDLVARHILGRFPGPLAVVGFSLGGNILLKWMGEQGVHLPDRVFGFAACVPYDLGSCARRLEEDAVSRLYRAYMVRRLKARVRVLLQRFPQALDSQVVDEVRTLTDFDDRVTAPLNGFRDAEDYWEQCSSMHYLGAICRPVRLINAADDPFLRPTDLPLNQAIANPCLTLEITEHGGHLGYIGPGWNPWIEARITRCIRAATGM
ncbi:MAG: alpha/beta fold hydrolase [Candidatus Eremiobacterota bacterium]